MSAPPADCSSGAAESSEEACVGVEDARDRLRLGCRIPLVELKRSAKDDAVGSREHVARTASEGVANFRLRLEDRELASGRSQLLVAEQVAAAKARAVEDQRFGQRGNLCR